MYMHEYVLNELKVFCLTKRLCNKQQISIKYTFLQIVGLGSLVISL